MNPESKTFESRGETIPFSPDFAQRVLAEARRTRIASRRWRTFWAGAAVLLAVAIVGLRPMHARKAPAGASEVALLAVGDLNSAEVDITAEEDADADPGSYLVPGADQSTDDGEDSDVAIFDE